MYRERRVCMDNINTLEINTFEDLDELMKTVTGIGEHTKDRIPKNPIIGFSFIPLTEEARERMRKDPIKPGTLVGTDCNKYLKVEW